MEDTSEGSGPSQPSAIRKFFTNLSQRYQTFLDSTVPHLTPRWITTLLMMFLFMARIFYLQGWYIVTYALGIYQLNLFIAFLTPKIDPALDELEEDGPELPTKADQEFRPFIRRLPEFKFWYGATRAVVVATVCTFFEFFNIPVFWPILVMYFIVLFIITMKRQIKHMIKYRYLPFTYGKQKYRGKDDSGDVMKS
ncbi:PREDICTED: protein RER1-like isoform X2 [Acropora digitifera]|uniref:protein RER1-like isoform X2 n=1 Tax=Acropora digitifera TaxID=70779 RepID=UPI00077A1FE7|nr:PREDICTED: protein RER1-like isoform X2 [Acropora digitifera]XP_029194002.2 protein RER1-like isoform X2 [Acropora millepora]